jgi:hypothetical protein
LGDLNIDKKDNITIYFNEIGHDDVDWMQLAQDRSNGKHL